MKKISFMLLAICTTLVSCSNEESANQDYDAKTLEAMHNEIISMSLVNTMTCTNAQEWSFKGIGVKPCGGVASYIPYATNINLTAFETKIKAYNNAVEIFNKKSGANSPCDITPVPKSVACVEGKPTLIYQ